MHRRDDALIRAWEHGLDVAKLAADRQLRPFELIELHARDVTSPELMPNFRGCIRNHWVNQRRRDSQSFRGGIENRCQARPAALILLFAEGPRFHLDQVFVYRAYQRPCGFERSRQLVIGKELVELADDSFRQLSNVIIYLCPCDSYI